ncbi:MAG: hypothetical protein ACTH5B_15875 [Marinomonas sp.]|uniref:hypothetical protein n=1 Tax=Marinomonas sp. TaxID=1904862 RepID=UPI003F9D388B
MSITNKKDLSDSVKKVCKEFNLPSSIASKLIGTVTEHFNDPRRAKKEAVQHFTFNWQNDLIRPVLLASELEDFTDNHISFVVARILALAHLSRQWRDAKKVSRTHPYLQISLGPTLYSCPVHSDDAGKSFPVDSDYWEKKPLRENLMCGCSFRAITKSEAE